MNQENMNSGKNKDQAWSDTDRDYTYDEVNRFSDLCLPFPLIFSALFVLVRTNFKGLISIVFFVNLYN